MKSRIAAVAALIAVLSLPAAVHANEPVGSSPPTQQKSMGSMPCPMMGDMSSMQKNMGTMMGDMNGMMQMMSDPAMKDRMQKMQGNMGAMMQQMTDMQKGMGGKGASDTPAAVTPEDHAAHHPDKK